MSFGQIFGAFGKSVPQKQEINKNNRSEKYQALTVEQQEVVDAALKQLSGILDNGLLRYFVKGVFDRLSERMLAEGLKVDYNDVSLVARDVWGQIKITELGMSKDSDLKPNLASMAVANAITDRLKGEGVNFIIRGQIEKFVKSMRVAGSQSEEDLLIEVLVEEGLPMLMNSCVN